MIKWNFFEDMSISLPSMFRCVADLEFRYQSLGCITVDLQSFTLIAVRLLHPLLNDEDAKRLF